MTMEFISDLSDPRLDAYARLTEVQLRNKLEPERGIFIAESDKVIVRALDAGYEPVSLVVPEHRVGRERALIERIAALDGGVPTFVLPAEELQKLAGFELTRGVLCAMCRKPLPSVGQVIAGARRVAVLEGLTNHTNVGAAFRSAAALGIDAVLVTPDCCDPLYRRAIRVSMGTVFQVPWTRIGSEPGSWPGRALDELRAAGFATCALALKEDAVSLDDPVLKAHEKLAVLMGTEGAGLTDAAIEACDHVAIIPMAHGVDSLNVAAASAVAFWELRVK